MSAILAGAALREEIKKITAAKKDKPKPGTQEERSREEKEQKWETDYLDWVFYEKRAKKDNETSELKFIGNNYYLLTANDFADPAGFIEEFKKKDRTTQAEALLSQFTIAFRQRLNIRKFDKWVAATLLAEINWLLKETDLSRISIDLPKDTSSAPGTMNESLRKPALDRQRLQLAFPDAIDELPGANKKEMELDEKSVKLKKLTQALRAAGEKDRENPALKKDEVQIYRMLSPAIRYALLNGDFEKTEIQMAIEELNHLLQQKESIFSDSIGNVTEVKGSVATPPREKDAKPVIAKGTEAVAETAIEKLYLDKGDLSEVTKNRLRLQMAFPVQIAKVWDSLPVLYAWIHAHDSLNALCLSGGGIRSATFGLGVLQGLAENDVLNSFDYLSTVSGGGYIGGWLSAWSKRSGNLESVREALTKRASDPMQPEPLQLRHLREYSNYLTPKLGLTSGDTWTLIGTYLRNLSLNWLVFLPAIATVLALPRIWVAVFQLRDVPRLTAFAVFATGMLFAISAIVYTALNRPSLSDPRNAVRGTGKFLVFCLGFLCISAFCLTAFWAWLQNTGIRREGMLHGVTSNPNPSWILFVVLGMALHVLAWGAYVGRLKKGYRRAELSCCVLSGMVSGFLLWVAAKAWHTDFDSVPVLECFVCFGIPYYLLSIALGVFFFVGITSRFTEDTDREWWARMGAWILLAGTVWAVFSTLVLFGPEWLLKLPRLLTALGGLTGVITLVLSHSGASPANKKEKGELGKKAIPANSILGIAAPVFVAVIIMALSLGTTWLVTKFPIPHIQFECDGATLLSKQDIKDLPLLVAHLKEHEDGVSRYLWSGFTPALRSQLTAYDGSEVQTKALQSSLTDELNDVIRTSQLATNAVWLPGNLSNDLKETLAQDVHHEKRMQRNRFLLEMAYPRELVSVRFDPQMITHESHWLKIILLTLVLAGASFFLSHWIDINRFSLHAVYRNRLIRAYLGASNSNRRPNAFTGFDPADNLHMAELNHRPFHIVNMALNLVTGDNLAWQQRKADSFTASPLHAGAYRLGFRKVAEYASLATDPSGAVEREATRMGQQGSTANGLTLGTSVTISGAAASPNMGYHSSPPLAALMTLFNIRLGAWLGNPGKAGDKSYKDGCPRSAFRHLVMEALGWTGDKSEYVYLSDGGHFENLGLYEMVRRRCRQIVVSDAGCDPKCALEDLGNAIRKIRIDLGIPIEIPHQFQIYSRSPNSTSKYCARGIIHYAAVDGEGVAPGELLYIKPAISGDEPKDVFNYKESSLLFPHESTSDQWFSESQFESYRMLGKHILDDIWRGNDEAKAEKEPDRHTQTRAARELEQLEESDPLDYLIKAARQYLNKPLADD